MSVARRVRQVLREEGLTSLCFKVLGEFFYRRQLVMERVLEGDTSGRQRFRR